jgi:putative restriction endonuclease
MITRDEVWQRVQNLNVWRRGKQRAPHKPLLLLLSLSRLTQRLPRLATFAKLEDPLKQLLIRYGPPRRSQHPEYPFWRLQTDGLWEVPNSASLTRRKGNTDPLKRELVDNHVEGGLTEEVFHLLSADPVFVREIAISLVEAHFPEPVRDDLLAELGLRP